VLRRLFTAASVVSLLLCAAVAGLWIRSYSTRDSYFTENGDRDFTFESNSGVLRFVEHRGGLPKNIYPPCGFTHNKPYPVTFNPPNPGEPGIRSQLQVPGLSWLISDGGRVTAPIGIPPSLIPPGSLPSPFTFYPSIKANVSYWLLIALAGIPPAMRLFAWWRYRHPQENGCCPACGYDLRASAGRCPECGTPIPSTAVPAEN
jgi:hypothetical protein